ncbi:MAG: RNA methyltransferase [Prevotella sp.]|nr:RNA methyltransferase [Prevotella sp.]
MISKGRIKLIRSLEQKKYRRQEGLFVAEGPKIVSDLLSGGFVPRMIIGTSCHLSAHQYGESEIVEVTEEELRKVSFLQHPQNILGVFEMKRESSQPPALDGKQLSLVLDGIQDPGNLGTIIRIADWFGIETIFCSHETADAYNPKVVQATMGSLARVNIIYTDLEMLIDSVGRNIPVYGTFLDGKSIYEEQLSDGGLIVMGNEGNGISAEIRRRITHRLLIPNYPKGRNTADSLNVAIATAITCAEFRRRI